MREGPCKPRQLIWEDMAKKIKDGVCAGVEDGELGLSFETGKPLISTKWVDVNEGTAQNHVVWSRLPRISASRASPRSAISLRRFRMAVRRSV